MQAVILAAHVGRRRRSQTDDRGQTVSPISGRTIIDRILGDMDCRSNSPIRPFPPPMG